MYAFLSQVLGVVATLVFEVLKWTIESGQLENRVEESKVDSRLRDRLNRRVWRGRMPDADGVGAGRKPGPDTGGDAGQGLGA